MKMKPILLLPLTGEKKKTKYCIECKHIFTLNVNNQLYCSSKCKTKNYYQKYKSTSEKYYKEVVKKDKSKLKSRKDYMKVWRCDNKDKMSKQKRLYYNKRMKEDTTFKLKHNLSGRLRNFLKNKDYKKTSSIISIVGCSPLQLKKHLEKQFTKGMNWNNYGLWHIDHIKPLASAKSDKEVFKLCRYSNLQPLWAKDNLRKGCKYE